MKKTEITNQKNQHLTTQKTLLRNLDGEKELQQSIVYCAIMTGQKPEKMEIQIASKFIKSNYPLLNIEDVIKAFEMNSSGKHWTIIEPFGSFNTLFIGKILTSFETYKRNKKAREKKSLPEPEKKDLMTHKEAKPYLKKLSEELKKMDLKFRINQKNKKNN